MAARVLLAEDHPTMREAVRMVLAGEGYRVTEAADGAAALAAIAEAVPDVIVLDLHMPVMDGAEVLSAVRAESRHGLAPGHHRDGRRRRGQGGRAAVGGERVRHEAVRPWFAAADARAGPGSGRTAGSVTVKVVPSLGWERTSIHPPIASVSCRVM